MEPEPEAPNLHLDAEVFIDSSRKDRYKSMCQKLKEGKGAYCKICNTSYFNVIKTQDDNFPNLVHLELYCPKCELTYCIATVDAALVGY